MFAMKILFWGQFIAKFWDFFFFGVNEENYEIIQIF